MTQDEAKNIALSLKDNWHEIAQLWEITKHYDTTGQVLEKQKAIKIELKAGEGLTKRLNSLRTYISPSYLLRKPEAKRELYKAGIIEQIKRIEQLLQDQEDEFISV